MGIRHDEDMARGASARARRLGLRGLAATLLIVVMTGTLAACTSGSSEPSDGQSPSTAALRVTTVPQPGLDEGARARLESEVSDVLARYVQAAFLGDYPRGDFVQSFEDFTSGAAQQAVGDIDVLTADRFATASSVRATALGTRLSFLLVKGEAVGATAWIEFAFDVDDQGTPTTVTLEGRLMLDRRDNRWSVFAYDVSRDDSDALPAEVSTS